jgi:hypothetical protein
MYVVVQHQILNPEVAFQRGQALIDGVGAPEGTRALQFYPHVDGSAVTCLFEAPSVEIVERYVEETLGDSSTNTLYQVDEATAFSGRALGLAASPATAV